MDIHQEKWDYTAMLVAEDAITQDQCDTLKLSDGKNMFYSEHLASTTIDCINWGWSSWLKAKAPAVPKKTVQLHLVWNENKDECVGFLDSRDARYTATGDDRGMFGVTALGDYFRDLNDERDEFETQIVMIEAQEQNA
jgi:hypothetical protein